MSHQWEMERVRILGPHGFNRAAQADCYAGLAVHRAAHDQTCWTVTHAKSGYALSCQDEPIKHLPEARSMVYALCDLGVDWTLAEDDLRAYVKVNRLKSSIDLIKENYKDA